MTCSSAQPSAAVRRAPLHNPGSRPATRAPRWQDPGSKGRSSRDETTMKPPQSHDSRALQRAGLVQCGGQVRCHLVRGHECGALSSCAGSWCSWVKPKMRGKIQRNKVRNSRAVLWRMPLTTQRPGPPQAAHAKKPSTEPCGCAAGCCGSVACPLVSSFTMSVSWRSTE